MGCDMIRGINRFRFLVGLAVFGAMVAGGSDSRAGIVISHPVVQPVMDPFYNYQFEVELTNNTSLEYGDSITVQNLLGVAPGAGTSQPQGPLLDQYGPFAVSIVATTSIESNITWLYSSLTPINNTSGADLILGYFTVYGNVQVTNNSTPTSIIYVGSTHSTTDPSRPPQ